MPTNRQNETQIFRCLALAGAVAAAIAVGVTQYAQARSSQLQGSDPIVRVTENAEGVIDTLAKCVWESDSRCKVDAHQVEQATKATAEATGLLAPDPALQAARIQADALYAESIQCHAKAQGDAAGVNRTPDSQDRATCDDVKSLASAVLVSSSTAVTEQLSVQVMQLEHIASSSRYALATALGVLLSGLIGVARFLPFFQNKKVQ